MMKLSSLEQFPYVTVDIVNKCKEAGILSVLDFLSYNTETLCQKISTPFKTVSSIRRVLLGTFAACIQNGRNLYEEQLESLCILTTGCQSLNNLLGGGIYAGEITEIHGHPGAGKSQLCMQIAAHLVAETNNTVLYLNTNSSFTGTRFKKFVLGALENHKNIEENLKRLCVVDIYDIYDLFAILEDIEHRLNDEDDDFHSKLKLLIVDSLTPLMAPYMGCPNFVGQGLLATAAQWLKTLCSERSLVVIVCNNMVRSDDSSGFTFIPPGLKPALGRYWSHVPSVALCMKKIKSESDSSVVSLAKSCRSAAFGEAVVAFSDEGLSIKDA